jgi:DNA mismatch repair protein MutL
MKQDRAEAGFCADIISRIALANPDVSFYLFTEDKKKISLSRSTSDLFNSRITRAAEVMGKDFAENSLEINATREGIKLTGLVSLPTYNKANSLSQYLFVNNRPVRDKLLLGALKGAYHGVLETQRYPACVLFLEVDPMFVDVNVHPTKAEVRFFDQQGVRSLLVGAIREALLKGDNQTSTTDKDNFISFLEKKSQNILNDFAEAPSPLSSFILDENAPFTPQKIEEHPKISPLAHTFQSKPSNRSFGSSHLPELEHKFSIKTQTPPQYSPRRHRSLRSCKSPIP